MINFTVGPVQSHEYVKKLGAEDVPYFRTPEFSEIILESERMIKTLAGARDDARVVFITGSGTASMEAVVMNVFTGNDKVLIVNGGGFGDRFVQICKIHGIPFTEIKLESGKTLDADTLMKFDNQGYTGFLVNIHETSTGVYYDPLLISNFCRKNNIFLVVDAISSFLADDFEMEKWDVEVMITGSQKALACPPGVSIIVLSPLAVKRVKAHSVRSLYFDLEDALKNGERGQTPFTPAVGTLLQIHARLKEIEASGGYEEEKNKIASLAMDFREGIVDLPLSIYSNLLSNAVTPLETMHCSAYDIFNILKDEYDIWICPNGGDLKENVFRVGHIGNLTKDDNHKLIEALHDLVKRGTLK